MIDGELDQDWLAVRKLGRLPKPIPQELYDKYFELGVVRKENLEPGEKYLGICRNADVAIWTGKVFVYNRHKFGVSYQESINGFEDDNGYDLFIPVKKI